MYLPAVGRVDNPADGDAVRHGTSKVVMLLFWEPWCRCSSFSGCHPLEEVRRHGQKLLAEPGHHGGRLPDRTRRRREVVHSSRSGLPVPPISTSPTRTRRRPGLRRGEWPADRAGSRDLTWPRAASRRSPPRSGHPVSQAGVTTVIARYSPPSEARVTAIALKALVYAAVAPGVPTLSQSAVVARVPRAPRQAASGTCRRRSRNVIVSDPGRWRPLLAGARDGPRLW